jgi:hypothetical protein
MAELDGNQLTALRTLRGMGLTLHGGENNGAVETKVQYGGRPHPATFAAGYYKNGVPHRDLFGVRLDAWRPLFMVPDAQGRGQIYLEGSPPLTMRHGQVYRVNTQTGELTHLDDPARLNDFRRQFREAYQAFRSLQGNRDYIADTRGHPTAPLYPGNPGHGAFHLPPLEEVVGVQVLPARRPSLLAPT